MANTSSPQDIAGRLEWDITEAPAWKTIYHGRREVTRDDIDIIPPPEQFRSRPDSPSWRRSPLATSFFEHYRKRIQLEHGFFIEQISTPYRERKDLVGFGLKAQCTNADTFSWEWFNIIDDEHAKKNWEGGELRIRLAHGAKVLEVARTEFLTDVSLRLMTEGGGCLLGLLIPPRSLWRIRILKGSEITWPLVNEEGEAAPN